MKSTATHKLLIAISVTAASFMSTQAAVQLAVNGDFETGDTTGWASFPTANSTFTVTTPGASGSFAGTISNLTSGSAAVIKQANLGAGMLTPGMEITIMFDFLENSGPGGVVFAELFSEIAGGGVSKQEILGGAPLFGSAIFSPRSFTTTLGSDVSGGVTLQFAFATGAFEGSTSGGTVDNVSITVIPEPASGALIGLAGLVLVTRRRRQA
ncbi:MAG: PEP-CTERM sorting domain-containing protein [Akkermansiaceae bacterium]